MNTKETYKVFVKVPLKLSEFLLCLSKILVLLCQQLVILPSSVFVRDIKIRVVKFAFRQRMDLNTFSKSEESSHYESHLCLVLEGLQANFTE